MERNNSITMLNTNVERSKTSFRERLNYFISTPVKNNKSNDLSRSFRRFKAFIPNEQKFTLTTYDKIPVVLCDKTYNVIKHLTDIIEEIKHSEYIPSLKEGWDEENAQIIKKDIYDSSIYFLVEYSNYISSHLSTDISKPEINPCADGSIDLSWRSKNARLLINISSKRNQILAYYYGDLNKNQHPISGILNPNDPNIDISVAKWMEDNLGSHVESRSNTR